MSTSKWWWPFGKEHKEEAEETRSEFQSQLKEALLRKDDLRAAAASMKKERIERMQRTQSGARSKLESTG